MLFRLEAVATKQLVPLTTAYSCNNKQENEKWNFAHQAIVCSSAFQQGLRKICSCVPWVLKASWGDREGSSFITSIYFWFQYIKFLYVVVFRV